MSAQGDIASGHGCVVPDIAMAPASNTRGYSGETISPTIKSMRKKMDVFVTLKFWHICRFKSKAPRGRHLTIFCHRFSMTRLWTARPK
jgi:hypothetical protein